MSFTIDEQFLQQTLIDLVQIDSRSSTLTPGAPGEEAIGQHIAQVLTTLGMEVHIHALTPGRVNTVGILRGRGQGRSLMLNGHMDTVGVEGMAEPFSGRIDQGKLYGRGSQDMKASLAAMIATAKALIDANISLAGDLILTFVADEEHLSIGTEDIVKHYSADAAIVTEPTDMAICRAHGGFIWYEVETMGRAAHGSRHDEGIDANMRMGRFLAALDELAKEVRQYPPHPLVGPPSLHASKIHGGTELSVYAAHCLLQMERRIIPGETEAAITDQLQAIVTRLATEDPTFQATVKSTFIRSPFEVAADADIVKITENAATRRLGKTPGHMGATFWTDAALLADAGIETVIIGPVGQGLHAIEEWVDLQSVVDLTAILTDVAIEFCGKEKVS